VIQNGYRWKLPRRHGYCTLRCTRHPRDTYIKEQDDKDITRRTSLSRTPVDITDRYSAKMAKLTNYNIWIGMIVAIGTFGYGYGFGVFITSIGQPGFYKDFDLDRERVTLKFAGGVEADVLHMKSHEQVYCKVSTRSFLTNNEACVLTS
jgi:hypothetical protein